MAKILLITGDILLKAPILSFAQITKVSRYSIQRSILPAVSFVSYKILSTITPSSPIVMDFCRKFQMHYLTCLDLRKMEIPLI